MASSRSVREVAASGPEARVFLSWAHGDLRLKCDLLRRLRPCLRILADVQIAWWEDSLLLPGEEWQEEILARLDEAEYGMHLISPALLASSFIDEHEIERFLEPALPQQPLPVGLVRVPLDGSFDLRGFDRRQVFTYKGRFYNELSGADRDGFATALANAVRQRLLPGQGWQRV